MKLCWDTLNKVYYSRKSKTLIKDRQIVEFIYCSVCGEECLVYKNHNTGVCSRECRGKLTISNNNITYNCSYCNKEHTVYGREAVIKRYQLKHGKHGCFCDNTCHMGYRVKLGLNKGKNNSSYIHGLSRTKAYKTSLESKRRAMKLNQTPELTGLGKERILNLYRLAKALPGEWHVDHIIPISKGGLHHPDNLQIITAEDNMHKHNSEDYHIPLDKRFILNYN